MATVKRRRRGRRAGLSDAEFWSLALGEDPRNPAFETPFLRRAAWFAHKDELLADCEGFRPQAWWEFSAPGPKLVLSDGREEDELAALIRLGVATPAEKRMVAKCFELRYGRDPEKLEELFKFRPYERVRYEHEKKLIDKLLKED